MRVKLTMYIARALLVGMMAMVYAYEKKAAYFSLCPNRRADYMDIINEKESKSSFDCAAECVKEQECHSVNYIENGQTKNCQLIKENLNEVDCSLFVPDASAKILKMNKECPKNTTTGCHYGQPHDGTLCNCGPGFTGDFCENPPRDCDGFTTNADFYIYPKVKCDGVSVFCNDRKILLIDTAKDSGFTVNVNSNWNTYKQRFGTVNDNYWLGLDNVHDITVSGKYVLQQRVLIGNNFYTAFYENFVVETEGKDYTIHFSDYNVSAALSNMLFDNTPFRTQDKNDNGCVAAHSSAFWYPDTCTWQSPLLGKYPMNGVLTNFTNYLLYLQRR